MMDSSDQLSGFGSNGESNNRSIALTASPNPIIDQVAINWNSSLEGNYQLQVFDLAGKLVQQQQGLQYAGYNTHELSLAGQPAGIYIIRLFSGTNTQTIKVTKS